MPVVSVASVVTIAAMHQMSSALKQRVITALILMCGLVLATTMLSPFAFAVFIAVIVLLAAWEWAGFIGVHRKRSKTGFMLTISTMVVGLFFLLDVLPGSQSMDNLRTAFILSLGLLFWILAFFILWGYPANAGKWNNQSKIALMGLCALLPTWVGLVQLKFLLPNGYLVIGMIVMVAAVDIGAYFFGMALGHTKLAPKLSPNKSWEGVWGGLLTCFTLGVLLVWALNEYVFALQQGQRIALILLSLTVTFFGVTGDLVESMLKRNCQIKDSGSILPGHGGLLDRVDGLMAVTPAFVLTVLVTLTDI